MLLTSPANPLLKKVKRAVRQGGLTADGLIVAESIHLLREAVRSGLEPTAVMVAGDSPAAKAAAADLPDAVVREVAPDLFAGIASTESSQGLIALIEPRRWTLDDLAARPGPLVILDGLQDPGNAGAVVRSTEAFDAAGVIFATGSASPFHPKTLRASAGSLFRLPYVTGYGTRKTLDAVGTTGRDLLAATAGEGEPIERVDWTDTAVIIGSEAHGVRPEFRERAAPVHIVVSGVESLNAAAAASVILYEARRRLATGS